MVRKIVEEVPDRVLQEDLERYRQMAMDLGAADAKIATTDTILIDERLRAKCFVPACSSLGKNAHCPPHALDLDFMCRVVKNFRYVLFYMLKIPSEELVGPGFKEKKPGRRSATLN